MKARVKATGEIVEISEELLYVSTEYFDRYYNPEQLELLDVKDFPKDDPDYWTRLEHQYAGMAMQGFCVNPDYRDKPWDRIAEDATTCATALVEKLKSSDL